MNATLDQYSDSCCLRQAYERLCSAELLCLKREVAVCKGQTVECMTVRHYTEKNEQKMEVWMGSGMSDIISSQVSWTNVTGREAEVCFCFLVLTALTRDLKVGVGGWDGGRRQIGIRKA